MMMEYGIYSVLATNEINPILQVLVDCFKLFVLHYFPLEIRFKSNYPNEIMT